jgi:hypothetical protein
MYTKSVVINFVVVGEKLELYIFVIKYNGQSAKPFYCDTVRIFSFPKLLNTTLPAISRNDNNKVKLVGRRASIKEEARERER